MVNILGTLVETFGNNLAAVSQEKQAYYKEYPFDLFENNNFEDLKKIGWNSISKVFFPDQALGIPQTIANIIWKCAELVHGKDIAPTTNKTVNNALNFLRIGSPIAGFATFSQHLWAELIPSENPVLNIAFVQSATIPCYIAFCKFLYEIIKDMNMICKNKETLTKKAASKILKTLDDFANSTKVKELAKQLIEKNKLNTNGKESNSSSDDLTTTNYLSDDNLQENQLSKSYELTENDEKSLTRKKFSSKRSRN